MASKKIVLFIIALIGLLFWIYWGNTTILVKEIVIENSKIPKEFQDYKIAHVSDLHNKNWKNQLLDKLEDSNPDIIVITGDLVDSRNPDEYIALDFIIKAKEIAPIYFVTGNHEARLSNYYKLKEDLKTLGVRVLENESEYLNLADSKILLFGLNDPNFMQRTKELDTNSKILEHYLIEMNDGFSGYKILLAHRPELFQTYKNGDLDLTLSGHAHGGQIRLPFIGGIYAPGQGFFPKYDSGLYNEDGHQMIVSKGLGNSIIPIRINNNPELIIVKLSK